MTPASPRNGKAFAPKIYIVRRTLLVLAGFILASQIFGVASSSAAQHPQTHRRLVKRRVEKQRHPRRKKLAKKGAWTAGVVGNITFTTGLTMNTPGSSYRVSPTGGLELYNVETCRFRRSALPDVGRNELIGAPYQSACQLNSIG